MSAYTIELRHLLVAFTFAATPVAAHEAPPAVAGSQRAVGSTVKVAEETLPLDPRFSSERVRADVTFLSDDLLEGRELGTAGFDIAAQYVAARFAGLGLATCASDVAWCQAIEFEKTVTGSETPFVEIGQGREQNRVFEHRKSVIVGPPVNTAVVDVTAPAVFVGYGIANDLLGIDDYAGLDVKGKFAVMLNGYPLGLPSEEAAHASSTKFEAAAAHGAIGVLTIDTDLSKREVSWERRLHRSELPVFMSIDPDGAPHQTAPGIQIRAALDDEAAARLFDGTAKTLTHLRRIAAASEGRPKGFSLPESIRIRASAESSRAKSANIVGVIAGSDPRLRDQYVVLSAHIDHLGKMPAMTGDGPDKDRIYNGAIDNAAGVAVLLEVARVMSEEKKAGRGVRRSVIFLVTTGEEKGLLGSEYFARHPTVPIDRIVGNVGLDMPLLLYPFTDLVVFGAGHSTMGRLVDSAVKGMNIKLSPDPMPEEAIFVRSDHYSFVKQGVPAVFLMTGFANGGEAQWERFLKSIYHRPTDDLTQPINWRAGARFAEANWRITSALAEAAEAPRWYEGGFFQKTFARGARAERPR
jgi:Zn-dependent M28 family amino/carboxypeptidase